MFLGEGRESLLVIDVQRGCARVTVGTPAPCCATATAAASRPVAPVAAASTATPGGAFEAGVDLQEDLLLLLSARLGSGLALQKS